MDSFIFQVSIPNVSVALSSQDFFLKMNLRTIISMATGVRSQDCDFSVRQIIKFELSGKDATVFIPLERIKTSCKITEESCLFRYVRSS